MIERMAAPDASRRHPAATQQAVALDGRVAILRAGWREAAAWRQHSRERQLVEADQPHAKVFHAVPGSSARQSLARPIRSCVASASVRYSACAADARAVN